MFQENPGKQGQLSMRMQIRYFRHIYFHGGKMHVVTNH